MKKRNQDCYLWLKVFRKLMHIRCGCIVSDDRIMASVVKKTSFSDVLKENNRHNCSVMKTSWVKMSVYHQIMKITKGLVWTTCCCLKQTKTTTKKTAHASKKFAENNTPIIQTHMRASVKTERNCSYVRNMKNGDEESKSIRFNYVAHAKPWSKHNYFRGYKSHTRPIKLNKQMVFISYSSVEIIIKKKPNTGQRKKTHTNF